jgi:hypothetical protein
MDRRAMNGVSRPLMARILIVDDEPSIRMLQISCKAILAGRDA